MQGNACLGRVDFDGFWLKPFWLQSFCMTNSSSESSNESWSSSSTVTPANAAFLKSWQRWRPGWYFFVFLVNATATTVLFPMEDEDGHEHGGSKYISVQQYRQVFSGMMLASFASGCVAAFLIKRARASAHVRSASGYAIINWFQSMLACRSLSLDGLGHGFVPGRSPSSFAYVACRGLLYLTALFWMQKLIASRLDLLEQSSNRNYSSGYIRRLLRAQGCGALVTASSLCGTAICFMLCGQGGHACYDHFGYDMFVFFYWAPMSLATLATCVSMVASMVAARSLAKSFIDLQRVLHLAELKDASVAVRASLRRAQNFAALQVMGVCFSLVLTILVVPFVVFGTASSSLILNREFQAACVFMQALDFLGNAVAVLILSGSHRLKKADQSRYQGCQPLPCLARPKQSRPAQMKDTDWSSTWKAKVEELSLRGMTLRSLLHFYQVDLPAIPDWRYAAKDHKTRDVVRRVIIPLTSREECSYATSALNRDCSRRAQVMVTHSWGNSFNDLLAAVVSDAFRECSFRMAAHLLEDDCFFLSEILGKSSRLDDTYWICAFAVNQHSSICHSNPYDRDPCTHELHPV